VVKEGLFKERLTARVAYMKAVDHASFSTIRKFIRDVRGEKVWTWVFRAELYVLFKIDKSRGSKVLLDVPSRLDADGKEMKREAFNMAKRFRENGKAYFEFILAAVRAHFRGEPAPSLLPALG